MLVLGREYLNDFDLASSREWLVTNGIGGYASSTLAGANTRRYHGLLVAALAPPVRRTLMFYKIDEEIEIDGCYVELSSNEYHDRAVAPNGYRYLAEFRLESAMPTFIFQLPGTRLEKEVWMERGQNTTYVRYMLYGASNPVTLRLRLLLSYRDHHGSTAGDAGLTFDVSEIRGVAPAGWEFAASPVAARVRLRPSPFSFADLPHPLRLLVSKTATFESTGNWHWRFLHRREFERGLDSLEDAYCPGNLVFELADGESVTIAATAEEPSRVAAAMRDCYVREMSRREQLVAQSEACDSFSRDLVYAADQFIVSRCWPASDGRFPEDERLEATRSVIAGYHWFSDWTRDAFVSLPGLFLSTGRFSEARAMLRGYARYISEGMPPNYFPEDGSPPTYNSVDAALWYFYAIDRYLARTGDLSLLDELYPTLSEIIDWHLRGTRHNIRVDNEDGLLHSGEEGVQLTWMDAKIDDWVVTARQGKPVEVNALWYNALAAMATFERQIGKPTGGLAELAGSVWASFNEKFWNGTGGYLYDVIDCRLDQDASFRPNQLLAVSLPYPALRRDRWKAIVDGVAERLVTPVGLLTLPRNDPMYVGTYRGDARHRDIAYHQGTAWAWLLGHFVEAHLKVYGDRQAARQFLISFEKHFSEAGVGYISEIFDGDWPNSPEGCVAQAWSVAEILRAWLATA